jgi:periplasmic protein TorT
VSEEAMSSHRSKRGVLAWATLLLVAAVVAAGCGEDEESAPAAQQDTGPVPEYFNEEIPVTHFEGLDVEGGEETTYKLTTEKADEQWDICVSFPNGKDPYWTAALYGVSTQAKRLGVKTRVYDAGGYDRIDNQISQLENCQVSGADAIIVAAISDGVVPKLEEISAAGTPIIAALNSINSEDALAARALADETGQGIAIGGYVREQAEAEDGPVKVAYFPGPEGADFVADQLDGFEQAIEGSNIEIIDMKYGETAQDVQFTLVEDTLRGFEDIDWIVGNALAADAAVEAIGQAKRDEVKIASTFETEPVYEEIGNGNIEAVPMDGVVWGSAIAVDLAVGILQEEELESTNVSVIPSLITKDELPPRDHPGLAPPGYRPEFNAG